MGGDIITTSLGLWVMLKGFMVGEVDLWDHLGITLPALLFSFWLLRIPAAFFGLSIVLMEEKCTVALSAHAQCWHSGSCFAPISFSMISFKPFISMSFLAVALVWHVLRTKYSLRRQYTEDHWLIFFLDI